MYALSPAQNAVLEDYKRRAKQYRALHPERYSLANTAKRMNIKVCTFRSILRSASRGGLRRHHVPDKVIRKEYVAAREAAAKNGCHHAITSLDIRDTITTRDNGNAKFKSKSRVKQVATKNPAIRKPTCSPRHGAKARSSREAAYLLHHYR